MLALEITSLLKKFIARQNLVLLCLQALRPNLVAIAKGESYERILSLASKYSDTDSIGLWSLEWEYFIHGLGCRLIHINTEEPIEWDLPHIHYFDYHWAIRWIMWYVQHNNQPFLEKLETDIERNIRSRLDDAISQGLIVRHDIKQNKYSLKL